MFSLDVEKSKQFAKKVSKKYGLNPDDVVAAMGEPAQKGHNISTGGIEVPKLKNYIERLENLEVEKEALAGDIRDVFAEAKGTGFDVKTMRAVLKLRKQRHAERTEAEYMLDLYKRALQMDLFEDEA